MRKLVMMACAAILLSGCQSDQSEAPVAEAAEESSAVSERVTRQRSAAGEVTAPATPQLQGDPTREIPRLQGQFNEPGLGLTHMVDGSSPEAFAESLVLIASETSAEQYRELDSALRYLRMHSSAAWGGMAGLYQSLDNMTGEEIIQHARRLQAERRQR
ncbi:MAG: hypothetical protein ACXIUM_10480 [Wenzhouxiangella sp.]